MNFFIRILNIGISDIENFQDTEILNLLSSKISFEAPKSFLQKCISNFYKYDNEK